METSLSPEKLQVFCDLFTGNDKTFGQTILKDEINESGKQEVKSWTETSKPLTISYYKDHLEGKQGLGIVPINEDNNVNFAVVDVDVYKNEDMLKSILRVVDKYDLPLCPFRSKSGGLHLYLFFQEEESAADVIIVMKEVLTLFSLDTKTEIFPKQAVLSPTRRGNWINLPYFDYEKTERYLLRGGEKATFDDALLYCQSRRVTLKRFLALLQELPFADGPPCLQHIWLTGKLSDNEGRNNYLFSVGRYAKSKELDIDDTIAEANSRMLVPLRERELFPIVSSIKNKDYAYLCTKEPLCTFCKKTVCKTREFGVGNGTISDISFGQLTKFEADPPYYTWLINDKKLEFRSTADIRNQNVFLELCLEKLHFEPRTLTKDQWRNIVNNAFANIEVVEVEEENGMSDYAILLDMIAEFMDHRARTNDIRQTVLGSVFHDDEEKAYYFSATKLLAFITMAKGFKRYSNQDIHRVIRTLGGTDTKRYSNMEDGSKKVQVRVWRLPYKAVEGRIIKEKMETDFSEPEDLRGY